jgi:hypothetical protein
MGVMDFEVQRERRAEMLREAASRRASRGHRAKAHGRARGLLKLAGAWVVGR